mmetsp:Transcript_46753/g.111192  ORF Transcript_46753/g.111192 Transcript_46753/m.111192 type:complete len:255 (-) Transcript_46753:2009-2773(-)
MQPVDGLVLHCRVPPRVQQQHVVCSSEVQPSASCFQAAEYDLDVSVSIEALQRFHASVVGHAAIQAHKRHTFALQLGLDQAQKLRELREHDRLARLTEATAVRLPDDVLLEKGHGGQDLRGGAQRLPIAALAGVILDLQLRRLLQQLARTHLGAAQGARSDAAAAELRDALLEAGFVEAVATPRHAVAAELHADAAFVLLGIRQVSEQGLHLPSAQCRRGDLHDLGCITLRASELRQHGLRQQGWRATELAEPG